MSPGSASATSIISAVTTSSPTSAWPSALAGGRRPFAARSTSPCVICACSSAIQHPGPGTATSCVQLAHRVSSKPGAAAAGGAAAVKPASSGLVVTAGSEEHKSENGRHGNGDVSGQKCRLMWDTATPAAPEAAGHRPSWRPSANSARSSSPSLASCAMLHAAASPGGHGTGRMGVPSATPVVANRPQHFSGDAPSSLMSWRSRCRGRRPSPSAASQYPTRSGLVMRSERWAASPWPPSGP